MGRASRPKGEKGAAPQIRQIAETSSSQTDEEAINSAERDIAEARASIDMPEASPVRVVEREKESATLTPQMAAEIFAGAAHTVVENSNPLSEEEKQKGARNKAAADRAARSEVPVHDKKMWVMKKSRQKLRNQTDKVWRKAGAELNMDPKTARKAFQNATGMRMRADKTKIAYVIDPRVGLAVSALSASNTYRKWNKSGAWEGSNIGQAMARNLGTNKKGRIRSIPGHVVGSAVPAVATAAASAAAFGTPMAPVTGLAMGGYAAGKTAMIWRDKRALDRAAQPKELEKQI